jgi:O-antigen ligase
MNRTFNINEKILLFLIFLIPIFGSIALGVILFLSIILSIYFLFYKSSEIEIGPFKKIGLIFISYFIYYSIHGIFFTKSILQHIHDIGKIFPILVFGVLAILIKKDTIKVTHKALSYVAILSIYFTIILALIFRYCLPEIIVLGETFTQKTGVMSRLEMGTGNALPFGTIFVTFAFMTCLDIQNKSLIEKITSFSALILAVLIVAFWNGSRGPLLVTAPLILLMFWFLYEKGKLSKNWVYLRSGVIAITVLVFLYSMIQSFGYDMSTNMANGLKQIVVGGPKNNSVGIRLTLYQASLDAFSTRPFSGFGIGNIFESIVDFLPKSSKLQFSHVHNMFLNHLLAGGLFGLLFLFLLIFSPIINLWGNSEKSSTDDIYLSLIITITVLGTGMSNVLFLHDLLAGFFCVLIFLSSIAVHNK